MPFEAIEQTVRSLLSDKEYSIPRNQRRYVWNEENWKELFVDITHSMEKEATPHFLGSIVLKNSGVVSGTTEYVIIDGQQRLTTLIIMLSSIMVLFKENEMNDDFIGKIKLLRSTDLKNQIRYTLNSEYHTAITQIIDKVVDYSGDIKDITTGLPKKDNLIQKCFEYFYEEIKKDISKNSQPLHRLSMFGDNLLNIIIIKIESNEEDLYTIFEILNARGQELESHELLKNYLMRYITPRTNIDIAKVKWESIEIRLGKYLNRFIKHYATHRFGDWTKKHKTPYKAIRTGTIGTDINALLIDLEKKSFYYEKFVNPNYDKIGDGNCTQLENDIFKFLKTKRQEQFRPIFLSLLHQKEKRNITEQQYEEYIQFIYQFFVCYIIIGEEKSNRLESDIYNYAQLIENEFSITIVDEFIDKLKRKIPSKELFRNRFRTLGWSNHTDIYKGDNIKDRVKVVLEMIEKKLSKHNFMNEFTIEHMYPDSQGEINASIGNLIPLEEILNSSCSDKPLDQKLEFYERSSFFTARSIKQRIQENGNCLDVSKRTYYLADFIYDKILNATFTP